ncbi:MAG: alpha/beta fold hydrolase [Bacteroidota bacterium]
MEVSHPTFRQDYIQTNGIRLHTILAGPEEGQPVVLLHGFPEFWRGWIRQLPALAEAGYRLIVPDQRGYNLSDKPKGVKSYRAGTLVDDITGLMDALGYERAHLVGHDWGGIVAWMLAARHPERLRSLSILNAPHPAAMFKHLTRDAGQVRRSWYALMFQLPWLPEAGLRARNWRGAVRALRGSGRVHTFTTEDIAAYREAWSQAGAITAMLNWYRAAFWYPGRMITASARVTVPTLVLWGMKDAALAPRLAESSMDYCDHGRLEFFPSATHWLQHEQAEAVNSRLLEFFSS